MSALPYPTPADKTNDTATEKGRVLCAMSGGVDSSLAAALLKEQGYGVQGAMLRFWPDNRPQGFFRPLL